MSLHVLTNKLAYQMIDIDLRYDKVSNDFGLILRVRFCCARLSSSVQVIKMQFLLPKKRGGLIVIYKKMRHFTIWVSFRRMQQD